MRIQAEKAGPEHQPLRPREQRSGCRSQALCRRPAGWGLPSCPSRSRLARAPQFAHPWGGGVPGPVVRSPPLHLHCSLQSPGMMVVTDSAPVMPAIEIGLCTLSHSTLTVQ